MSFLSASSAFTLTARTQGLFSSHTHTAFKKPTFNTHVSRTSNDNCTRLLTPIHPKDLAQKQVKTAKIFTNNEDSELIISEPIKKIKSTKGESAFSVPMNNNKTQQNTVKPLRLTIEEVFNTPIEAKPARKSSLLEDCFDEGSSLSFISSHSSFDNLDDEAYGTNINRKQSDCMIIGSTGADMQSLVVKDDIVGRLSYLNQEAMLFNNLESQSMFFPTRGQESVFQPATKYVEALPVQVGNTNNHVLCMPANNLNEYIQFSMHSRQQALQLGLNLSDKTMSELVKNSIEDGYDSDSYATRSTSVEQEGCDNSDKSQKGASPAYSGNDDLYAELQAKENRLKEQIKQKKAEKARKQAQNRANNNNKEKKGRSLNLRLDVNPKQLKVQRRLNRLQLLRYQGASEEEDEELKKFGISDLLSRANSSVQEGTESPIYNENKTDNTETQFVPVDTEAVIPPFGQDGDRRRRVVPVWNPEVLEEESLQEYFRQLGEVLENPVNDIEAAIKLLRDHNMDILLTLETVKADIAMYSEVFRLKVKRLRRRGA